MAEKKDETKKKPVFEITVPNSGYRGERNGVTFLDGKGRTEDAKRAHACLEITGATVTKDGKPWPEPEKSEQDPAKK